MRVRWIPACAGMTGRGREWVVWGGWIGIYEGAMDSRLRGNDGGGGNDGKGAGMGGLGWVGNWIVGAAGRSPARPFDKLRVSG